MKLCAKFIKPESSPLQSILFLTLPVVALTSVFIKQVSLRPSPGIQLCIGACGTCVHVIKTDLFSSYSLDIGIYCLLPAGCKQYCTVDMHK